MNKQLTFSLISDEPAQAKTSKKEFLEKIEQIIPFDEWIGIIRPCYYKGEHGNKPYDLELMLRIFLLQNLYDLSDMKVMNEVIDSRAFSNFCGVDKDSGLVHHLKVTGANEHDVTATPDLMHGEEEELYGDSGYIGAEKRENAVVINKNGRKIKYKINRKPSTMKKLSKSGQYASKKAEHKKSSVRAKVEHVFAVVKRLFVYWKTRYRGLRQRYLPEQ